LPSASDSLELAERSNEALNDLVVLPTMLRRDSAGVSPSGELLGEQETASGIKRPPDPKLEQRSPNADAPFRLPPSITQVSSPSASRQPKFKRESRSTFIDSSSCRSSNRFVLGGTLMVGSDSPLRDSLAASLRFSSPTPLRWARSSARRDDATRTSGEGSLCASPAHPSPCNSPITPKPQTVGWSGGDLISRGSVLKPSNCARKLSKVSEVMCRWRLASTKRVHDLSTEQLPPVSHLSGPNDDAARRATLLHATLIVSTGPTGDEAAPFEDPIHSPAHELPGPTDGPGSSEHASALSTPHLAPGFPLTPAVPQHLQHLDLTPASPLAPSPGAHGRPRAARKLDFSCAE